MDEKLKIANDVAEKLERLRWRLEQPELFISEHFASIRNEIDYDAERLIDAFQNINNSKMRIDDVNVTRTRFIGFLDNMEARLFDKLKDASSSSTSELLCELVEEFKRVEEFFTSNDFKSLNETEEAYLHVALEIIEATNEVERCMLDNQTICYVSHGMTDSIMGNLIYLNNDFLNQDELNCLKRLSSIFNNYYIPINLYFIYQSESGDLAPLIHETIQASLNESLAVAVSRPFNLSRKILILSYLKLILPTQSAGQIFYLKGFSRYNFNNCYNSDPVYRGFTLEPRLFLRYLNCKGIDSVLLGNVSPTFSDAKPFCNLYGNRLRRFEIADSIIKLIESLNLGQNQLEMLDVEQLAKAVQLRDLNLVNAFIPEARFSLGFLTPRSGLSSLKLTLPDVSIDFKVFKNLENLHLLELHSATSLDSTVKRLKLTKDHFKQLSRIKYLSNLLLSHFEIESLQKEMMSEFDNLDSIALVNNHIARIEETAFKNSFHTKYCTIELRQNSIRSISSGMFQSLSVCKDLDLSYNQIEQLPNGVFAELKSLRKLHLNNNSIRQITRGVFNNLPHLEELQIDGNLIESIDPHSFEGSPKITRLFLAHNKLKSINYQNEIQSNEIEESDHKKKSLFCELVSLETLSLEGNQLEKVDLNFFSDLTKLIRLNLSNNRINELNETIQAGVLSNLIEIDLSNNQLTQISRHAFSESTKLIAIKLSANKLETLDEDLFEPFQSLRQLQLQNNNLSIDITAQTFSRWPLIKKINLLGNPSVRIRDGAFSRNCDLQSIELDLRVEDAQSIKQFFESEKNHRFFLRLRHFSLVNSSVERLDAFYFDDRFKDLQKLDLRGNRITSISRNCFAQMPRLRTLSIAENMIETLDDPTIFHDLPKLESLNLSGNKLKHIHRQLFKSLHKLQKLDLSNNPTPLNLDSGIFRGLFNLKQINLAGNNIASFDLASLFRSCRLLESLDLSNNQLDHESINEDTMSGSTAQNLKELMLANNRLENIDFVRHLYRLEKLDLSGNKIESVTSNGVNLFSRLVKLKHVNLSNNHINSWNINVIFSHLKYQLDFVDFSNNPFYSNIRYNLVRYCHLFIEKIRNLVTF